jgi:hypothetical protein
MPNICNYSPMTTLSLREINHKFSTVHRNLCYALANVGVSQVYTQDSATVTWTGTGVQGDPLIATSVGSTTLYTGNGTLSGARVVTMAGNTINFSGGDLGIDIAPLYDLHVENSTGIIMSVNTTAVSGTSGGKLYLYTKNLPSASNNELGSISFGSRNGASSEFVGANIRGVTNGAWTAGSNHQGAILFGITASGNSTPSTVMRLGSAGRLFVGANTVATAFVHIAAGTAAASGAPLKFSSGTNLTTPETGAMEYNGTNLFFTRTGTTRETVFVGVSGAAPPATNPGNSIVSHYGNVDETIYLSDPDSWASVVINGTTYKIPLYT